MPRTIAKATNQLTRADKLGSCSGAPSLILGEDESEFASLLGRIRASVKPTDAIEEIWVDDIVDLEWERRRLRRLKANLLQAAAYHGLQTVLTPLIDWREAKKLAEAWAKRDSDAIEKVTKLLAAANLPMDAVMA